MNVLYLINHAGNGGSEKYVLELANSFLSRGLGGVHFIYNEDGPLRRLMVDKNIPSEQIDMDGPFDIRAAKKIAAYCRKNKIDIIHTQFTREMYLAALAKIFSSGASVVYTSHINLKNSGLRKILNSIVCKKVDAIIAVCELGRELLIENKMPAGKISLIYNGVASKARSRDNHIRDEFGIPHECVVFVSLMRFTPEKGVMFLLESAKGLTELSDEQPFRLIISGQGDLFEEAREYVDKYLKDSVILTGYRSDTDKILAASDVFVNSSESEALSFAILEAMSHGLPVIATDVGGNPEIVNADTNCGALVPYGDVRQLAAAMLHYITDDKMRDIHGENSISAQREIFNKDRTVSDTFAIYGSLI